MPVEQLMASLRFDTKEKKEEHHGSSGHVFIDYGLMKSSIISATCVCCSAKLIEATTSPF